VRKTCNFFGNLKIAGGEIRNHPRILQSNQICKFYRCPQGTKKAFTNLRAASKGEIPWEKREVHDPKNGKAQKVPILEVTTFYRDPESGEEEPLKSGFVTKDREWEVRHDGKLYKTGQILEAKEPEVIHEKIRRGLDPSGL
jgi:hypothetical protein